jgi:hypothetical protein
LATSSRRQGVLSHHSAAAAALGMLMLARPWQAQQAEAPARVARRREVSACAALAA